jgi:hypothetical protein
MSKFVFRGPSKEKAPTVALGHKPIRWQSLFKEKTHGSKVASTMHAMLLQCGSGCVSNARVAREEQGSGQ